MKVSKLNLIPDTVNQSPDYYCTWQTQLYATSGGEPSEQRRLMNESALFNEDRPFGWAYFYEEARKDLILVMDDSWDVPPNNDSAYYGSLILNPEKFPSCYENGASPLKTLIDRVKALGWKSLGGWICAQESPLFLENKTEAEYWTERLIAADKAGFSYWKVDWGDKCCSPEFRKMLTGLARKYAPGLTVEQAALKELVPYCDAFRTYDVPAIMSVPMTLSKIVDYCVYPKPFGENKGIINCEDEAYIAAAGGFSMGIMRHPYVGAFPNGRADKSFPGIHRNIKSKLFEVLRAVHWHRIAPAFGGGVLRVSDEILTDTWMFENPEDEIEAWWFMNPLVRDSVENSVLSKTAPLCISRDTELPQLLPDENGERPFCVAAANPNGAYSVATLGRTVGRSYFIPECDVTVKTGSSVFIGVFGCYRSLTLETELEIKSVTVQDLAAEQAFDITEDVEIFGKKAVIPGKLISQISKSAQPEADTSEPGVVIRLNS